MSIIDMPDAIAVIGMSCRFPGAKNTYEFWENLKNGIESITDFSDDDLLKAGVSPSVLNKNDYVKRGFIIEDEDLFDASFFEYSPKEAEITDPQQRLFLETAWKALEEGGYSSGNYNGSIGVFAGSKISTYLINNFGKNSLFGDGLGFMRLIGNDKDYLATRASYKLNLEGPSISVQTACSTSLVSVHLACESLLNGECDMALAGGVSLIFPQKTGYLYQEGLMLSPDGRCRAFDSKAAGMAAGNGSGAVLLKRLEDAMGDNDNIHAVLRGSAVNNDGSNKVGYTTPSIQGQAKVIREALAVSEVEADSISYIETHGTGTELGDPVEIKALKKVFDSEVDKKGYCAIGSVKTNIGHLDTAAGVAGLIKTILSLKNKKIPPSLNFEKPNPKINFEDSPFFVNTKLRNWEKNGYPRRAGVSSFGFGGTNAHVIVEEAPVIQRKENAKERKAHLLTITAKTKKSLEGLVSRYRKFLEEKEDINIGDFCFTAGVGRTDFQYRIGIVGTTREDFISKLKLIEEGSQHPNIKSGYAEDISSSDTVFLFTGQGSQYSEMGKELYETCEYFKETMDECDGILFEHLDRSILSIIFDEKDSDLNETQYTQPALFVLEYAIAKLLLSWGIKPDAVMGHSVGEYVAACISGALSLEDALRLISSRALLMQSVKGESAMYSLFCKEADALELIGDNLDKVSIAAVNGPENTVVSGEKDAVEEVIKKCGQADASCRKLNVSHAFHSPMMSGMLPEFKTVLEKIEFLKPKIPVISNLTGDFIESFDEDYWCNHILEAVRFESGIQTLEKSEYKNFLEIGPSPVLMGMAKQCIKNDNINFIHTLKKNKKDWENLLCGVGELYTNGINFDWEKYDEPYNRYRISIPPYPFIRKRYWIEDSLADKNEQIEDIHSTKDLFHRVLWKEKEVINSEAFYPKKNSIWLIFGEDTDLSENLKKEINQYVNKVLIVKEREYFSGYGDDFVFTSKDPESYERVLKSIINSGEEVSGIIYLGIDQSWKEKSLFNYDSYKTCSRGVISLVQGISNVDWDISPKLCLITKNSQYLSDFEDDVSLNTSSVWGIGKVLSLEKPEFKCLRADLDDNFDGRSFSILSREIFNPKGEREVVLRKGKLFIPRLVKVHILNKAHELKTFDKNSTYLITGGFGAIGLELTKRLAEQGAENLVLISRRGTSEKSSVILSELGERINIHTYSLDVTDKNQVGELFSTIKEKMPPLKGIIHAAGILEPGATIENVGIDSFFGVGEAKIIGAWNLHEASADLPLDFFVCFSSIVSIFGIHGMMSYTAANTFLDSFSNFRKSLGLKTTTINWGPWAEIGVVADKNMEKRLESQGIKTIPPKLCLDAFLDCIESDYNQIGVISADWNKVYRLHQDKEQARFFEELENIKQSEVIEKKELVKTDSAKLIDLLMEESSVEVKKEILEKYLFTAVASVLGVDKRDLKVDQDLFQLGMDSLIFMEFSEKINFECGVKIVPKIFLEAPYISKLFNIIWKEIRPVDNDNGLGFKIKPDFSNRFEPFELTDIQHAYWVGRTGIAELGDVACHAYFEIDTKDLDLERYVNSWNIAIDRHDSLRTIIMQDGKQRVMENVPDFEITKTDMEGFSENKKLEELYLIREGMSHQVLPSDKWPLFDVKASVLSESRAILHISIDMLVADGFSVYMLMNEIFTLYSEPDKKFPDLEVTFRDYVVTENDYRKSKQYKDAKEYWLAKINQISPAPSLPMSVKPSELKSTKFNRRSFSLPKELWSKIKKNAKSHGITASNVLLSAYAEVLGRWSKNKKFTLNLTFFNRFPWHSQVNDIIGDFTSLVLLAVDMREQLSFIERARIIQGQLWNDMEHRSFCGTKVLQEFAKFRERQGEAQMPVVFTSNLGHEKINKEHTSIKFPGEISYSITQTPQVWVDNQISEDKGALIVNWDSVDDIFPEGVLDNMFSIYENLINILAQDEISWTENDFKMIPSVELNRKVELNSFKNDIPDLTLYELFERQVVKTPKNKAVITSDHSITYDSLSKLSKNLGSLLYSKGVAPGNLIAIIMEKGWEQVVGVLGVLAAGAAYIPIDPELPKDRILKILEDSEVKIALTQSRMESKIDLPEFIDLFSVDTMEIVDSPILLPDDLQNSLNLAYIIYTSGSTGTPKGVMINHRGAVNTILDINERFGVTEIDKIFGISNLNFDLSVYDIFGSLFSGAAIVIPDHDLRKEPGHWLELINKEEVTIWNSAPMFMQMLMEYVDLQSFDVKESLRLALLSGDWIPLNLPEKIESFFNNIKIISLGGATEASIWSILYPVKNLSPEWKSIPYGKPMKNQKVYIMDENLEICPDWVTGNIYIGGAGLAKGYLNDDKKNKASFIKHPKTDERLYKTGDLGRYLPDGNVEFLGRDDFQIKISGHRVELGEIESVINSNSGVKDSVVILSKGATDENQLNAYVVLEKNSDNALMEFSKESIADFDALANMSWNETNSNLKNKLSRNELEFFNEYLNQISYEKIYQVFASLDLFINSNEDLSFSEIIDKGGIDKRFEKLLLQWIEILIQKGGISQLSNGKYAAAQNFKFEAKSHYMIGEIRNNPIMDKVAAGIESYFEKAEKYFKSILQGKTEVLELFFGDESTISPAILSRLSPVTDVVDESVGKALESLCRKGSKSNPVRILEIGARTGESTSSFISYLSGSNTQYTASDNSLFFIEKIKDKFKDNSNINELLLNLEEDPFIQGIEYNSFDIIVMPNSLHRSDDLEKSLKNINKLLAPEGVLIIIENTKNSWIQKVTVGFIEEGFGSLKDKRAESGLPLLSSKEWIDLLDFNGLKSVYSILDNENRSFGQDIMIGRKEQNEKIFKSENLDIFLKEKLPQYMVPNFYLEIDSIPISSNGKVDRKALPILKISGVLKNDSFEAPLTSTEIMLEKIWRNVLKAESQLSISSNFFNVGGDSLLGTRIIAKVREKTSADISLRILFEYPTIKELAREIETLLSKEDSLKEISCDLVEIIPDRENLNEPFPVTDVQHAYLMGKSGLYELGNVAAHCYFEIDGMDPKIEKLNSAINRMISHHDMMRSVFLPQEMQQVILKEVPEYEMEVYNLKEMEYADSEKELLKIRELMSHQIIKTDQWPLFDIRISLNGENNFRLHISFDNSVFDGWSMIQVISELARLYKNPDASLPEIGLSFRDYILETRKFRESEKYVKDKKYWIERLETLPLSPDLPMAKKPEPGVHYPFSRFEFKMEKELWSKLKDRAKEIGVTPSGLLLAAYSEVLGSRSSNKGLTINLTTFNRFGIHKDVDKIIGDFTSLTLLAVDNLPEKSFKERAKRLQKQLWEDMDHSYYSGVEFLRELAKVKGGVENAKMPIVFTSALGLDSGDDNNLGGNSIGDMNYGISQTPQVLIDHQASESSGSAFLVWDTVKELFPEGFIEDMFNVYIDLLIKLAEDDKIWDETIPELISEKQLLRINKVNQTSTEFTPDLLHSAFEKEAVKYPEKDAVVTSKLTFSYGVLHGISCEIADILKGYKVAPNNFVAIVMDKGWEQVAAVLGASMAGAAYVPITSETPEERLKYIIEECEVANILTQSWLKNEINWPDNVNLIFVDEVEAKYFTGKVSEKVQNSDDLAYVIYTSGSTGKPKGVLVDHKGPLNTIENLNNRFNITSGDRVLALAELNFDLSVFDIFGTLSAGAAIVIPDSDKKKEPSHWTELIEKQGVTIWNSVPQLMQMMVDYSMVRDHEIFESLRLIMMSGDWIPVDLPSKIASITDSSEIISLGGATEASIWSIIYEIDKVDPQWKSIPYGRPLENQRFYVLNEKMGNCSDWVLGKLYIGGIGLAKGYLKDEEKTRSSFIKNPHTGEDLYFTGDLGRFLPDGNIEFIGRDDFQVKIRGYRVELGEIESIINSFPGISQSVIQAFDDDLNNKKLVAFVVHEKKIAEDEAAVSKTSKELNEFLNTKVSDYMIPSIYIFLDEMPLNTNGKIDRNSLPNPKDEIFQPKAEYCEPVSYHEKEVAEIWENALALNQIDINSNFFEIGGDSLIAVQLVNDFYEKFQVDIPLIDLFEFPTIAGMAAIIVDTLEKEDMKFDKEDQKLPVIVPDLANRYSPFPLTDVQQAYWLGRSDAYELGNVATHTYFEIENTDLDPKRLNSAWQKVLEHHEMLRGVVLQDGTQAIVENTRPYEFEIYDLRNKEEDQAQKDMMDVRKEMEHQILPVTGPLFDIRISLYKDNHIRIHLSFDALIVDGWSMGLIFKDWFEYYNDPNLEVTKSDLCYRDYVLSEIAFQDSDLYLRDKDYALERLASIPPAPELPLLKKTKNVLSPKFKRLSFSLEKEKWSNLKNWAKHNNLTPSGILIAAYAKVLGIWSKNKEFTINLTFFNRLPLHPEVNNIVGDFTSLTLLPIKNQNKQSFEIWAKEIQHQLWKELEHRYFSGVQTIREIAKLRNNNRAAIMPIVFTSLLGLEAKDTEISSIGRIGNSIYHVSQTPQVILDNQVSEREDGLMVSWDFVAELFTEKMINDMFDLYTKVLTILGSEADNWCELENNMIPFGQKSKIEEFNLTDSEVSQVMLHELFVKKVVENGDNTAVITSKRIMSYKELVSYASSIGNKLQKDGIKPNNLVGIVMEKGWEQIAGALGILMSGGAYLPIAADTPKERIKKILMDGEVEIILTQSHLQKELEFLCDIKFYPIDEIEIDKDFNVKELSDFKPVQLNTDLAYVIYTSGSTGTPKGVMIDHKGAVNTILDINKRFKINEEDRIFGLSALNFDLSVFDVFGTLAAGGAIVLPDPERVKDPEHWLKLIKETKITIWNSVPTLMRMLMEYVSGRDKDLCLNSIRLSLLSGDWIPLNLPDEIREYSKNCEVISLGGATEASIWSILYPIASVDPGWVSIPYGMPMVNQKFYVLDENFEICPEWVLGELFIGGIGLAKGYWKDAEKTNKSFVKHPETGELLYKTGDIGRLTSYGYIEFFGREDSQVKINGYRIELGEIESISEKYPGVENAVITAIETNNKEKYLSGYVVAKADEDFKIEDLEEFLSKNLNGYMLPSVWTILDKLPLTSNGKVDRKSLPVPGKITSKSSIDYVAPRNELEESIALIVSSVLGIKKPGIKERFFNMGANSLDIVRIQNKISSVLNKEISVLDLFEYSTIESLAKYLEEGSLITYQLHQANNQKKLNRKKSAGKRKKRLLQNQ